MKINFLSLSLAKTLCRVLKAGEECNHQQRVGHRGDRVGLEPGILLESKKSDCNMDNRTQWHPQIMESEPNWATP